jgi:hypothetical protein
MQFLWYAILAGFVIVSFTILLYGNDPIHEEIHAASALLAIILGALSFKAFMKYRISRLIFSGLAFTVFGIAEGLQMYIDQEVSHVETSLQEIEEYLIVAGISLFGFGTMFRVRKET